MVKLKQMGLNQPLSIISSNRVIGAADLVNSTLPLMETRLPRSGLSDVDLPFTTTPFSLEQVRTVENEYLEAGVNIAPQSDSKLLHALGLTQILVTNLQNDFKSPITLQMVADIPHHEKKEEQIGPINMVSLLIGAANQEIPHYFEKVSLLRNLLQNAGVHFVGNVVNLPRKQSFD